MNRLVNAWSFGHISYTNGLKLQNYLANLHHKVSSSSVKDTLLFVEHSPVYTLGIRTQKYSEEDEKRLKELGAEFYKSNRGGLITFHGPGQLVLYPIINLKNYKASVKWYVSHLEKTVIALCKEFGIDATTSPHTGVWVGDNKICAMGIRCSRYVTTHGIALNCNTDLDWYKHIVPCGIEDKGVTSLSQELGRNVTIEEVAPKLLAAFSNVFNTTYTSFPKEEADCIISQLELPRT